MIAGVAVHNVSNQLHVHNLRRHFKSMEEGSQPRGDREATVVVRSASLAAGSGTTSVGDAGLAVDWSTGCKTAALEEEVGRRRSNPMIRNQDRVHEDRGNRWQPVEELDTDRRTHQEDYPSGKTATRKGEKLLQKPAGC